MKVTLYNAISVDGYIATADGDSDWVSETDAGIFEEYCKEIGCIVVGHKTYKQYISELYPIKGITNIVLTSDDSQKSDEEHVIFVSSVKEAFEVAQQRNHNHILLVGGGKTNGSFLDACTIDELILSVHPLILGKGIKVFEDVESQYELDRVGSRELKEDLVQITYTLKK